MVFIHSSPTWHHDISSGDLRASRLHRLLEYQEHNLNDNNLCQIWIWSNFDIWCVKIHTFKVMYVLLFYIMTILFVQHISVSIGKCSDPMPRGNSFPTSFLNESEPFSHCSSVGLEIWHLEMIRLQGNGWYHCK